MSNAGISFDGKKLTGGRALSQLFDFRIFFGAEKLFRLLEARKFDHDNSVCFRLAFKGNDLAAANDESAAVLRDDCRCRVDIITITNWIGHIDSGNNVSWHKSKYGNSRAKVAS